MPSDTIVSPSAQNTLRARERDTFEDHVQKHMRLRPRRMADKEGRHLAEMQTNLPKRAVRAEGDQLGTNGRLPANVYSRPGLISTAYTNRLASRQQQNARVVPMQVKASLTIDTESRGPDVGMCI